MWASRNLFRRVVVDANSCVITISIYGEIIMANAEELLNPQTDAQRKKRQLFLSEKWIDENNNLINKHTKEPLAVFRNGQVVVVCIGPNWEPKKKEFFLE